MSVATLARTFRALPSIASAGTVSPPALAALAGMCEQATPGEAGPISGIMSKLDEVVQEVDALREEVNLLRRRDETLNFCINRLDEELRLAARLQQDFLPKSLPEVGRVRFHTLFRPAGYVSGDLYDVCRLDEHRVGFYVADAVGHGMPAALLTMFVKHALVTKEVHPPDGTNAGGYTLLEPGEALRRLNLLLVEQHLSQASFATAIYGIIDVRTLQLRFAKAGHPHPLLFRANDPTEEWLEADGALLGIFENATFTDRTVQLSAGDRVILYTDGIEIAYCDHHNPDEPRWKQELVKRRNVPSEKLLEDVAQQLDHEMGSIEPKDDLTMMIIEAI